MRRGPNFNSVLNVKALVLGAFSQEKVKTMIVKTYCETDESSAAVRRESLRQFPRFNPNLSFVAFNYNPLYLEFLGENRKKLQPGCGRTIYSELQTVNSRLKQ